MDLQEQQQLHSTEIKGEMVHLPLPCTALVGEEGGGVAFYERGEGRRIRQVGKADNPGILRVKLSSKLVLPLR